MVELVRQVRSNMAAVFVPPPLDAHGPVFEAPSWAKMGRHLLDGFPREIRVCSPCVGLNAPERAAMELRVPWKSVDVYDVWCALRPALTKLGNTDLNLGPRRGNVMMVDINTLQACDAIVSGPPCPPFSTIGKRLTDRDVRCSVFVQVGLWAVELARRPDPLSFFIFENVEGVLKKARHDDMPFAAWFSKEMSQLLPEGWDVRVVRCNSRDCGLAQSRPRVFIVGTCPAMRMTIFQRKLLMAKLPVLPAISLLSFLDLEGSDTDFEGLTLHQQLNVASQVQLFHGICGEALVGVIDSARDFFKGFDNAIAVDCVHTLRTSNKGLWLLPSPSMQGTFGKYGRFLRVSEKARLSGIVPSSLKGLCDSDAERALGNTIPVPLIGTVMVPMLAAFAEAVRQSVARQGELLAGPSQP